MPKLTLDQLAAAEEQAVLDELARYHAQHLSYGAPASKTQALAGELAGVRFARALLADEKLGATRTQQNMREALRALRMASLALGAFGRGPQAEGVDRVRTCAGRILDGSA